MRGDDPIDVATPFDQAGSGGGESGQIWRAETMAGLACYRRGRYRAGLWQSGVGKSFGEKYDDVESFLADRDLFVVRAGTKVS